MEEIPEELGALVALMHAGRWAELEIRSRTFLDTAPQSGPAWQLLGVALSKQGKSSLQPLIEAVKYLPGDATAHLNLGNAFGRCGRLEEALVSYQRALSLHPDFAQVHHNLGGVQLELDRLAEAIDSFRRAIQLRPQAAEAHQDLGKALLRVGQYEEALVSCERAVRLAPESAEAHNSLGNAYSRLGRFEIAIASFRRALALNPDFAEAHANLANALRGLGRLADAIGSYRIALRIKPDFVSAYTELATTLRLQQLSAESEAVCRQALRIAPESAGVFAVLAELRADAGRFAEAEEYFNRAVAIDAGCVEAWAGRARARRMTVADVEWLQATQGLVQRGLPPQREMTLRYALGKYFDDVKDYATAFSHYQRANELAKRCAPRHDREHVRRSIDAIVRAHDAGWLEAQRKGAAEAGELGAEGEAGRQGAGAGSPQPVFIVGMLRSGTSLAEQILASHPAVFGAGELSYWSAALGAGFRPESARLQPQSESARLQPESATLISLRSGYLQLLRTMAPQAERIVDKLPTNFLALGLISAALPGARIIHLQRHPIDTCLSIYFQQFEALNTYTHDLEDLADYHRQYQRLMEHWRTVLPTNTMLEVPYEGLVAEPEKWARAMLHFIGLPWDPRCLEFHRTQRTVITASKWQVRQGIDTSAIARWRHYESFLGPLLSLDYTSR